MAKNMKFFRLLFFLIVLLAGPILATPAIIGTLPDRYVYRLPEPLQKFGLPETQASLLPTVEAPVGANLLLKSPPPTSPRPLSTAISEATSTQKSSSIESKPRSVNSPTQEPEQIDPTPEPSPTQSATPIPPTATARPLPEKVRLDGFQHRFQTWNNCGPATLAMGLSYFGEQFSQEQTASILKPNPEDRNVSPDEMAAFVNEQTPYNALFRANGTIEILKALIANEVPVIIETGINPPGEFRWLGWYGHYLLIVAYSDEEDSFWVYDSWFGTSEEPLTNAHLDGRVISYEDLAQDWSQFNRNYIALFRPEQEPLVTELIGQEMDDKTMWENALARSKEEIELDPSNPFFWFNLGTNYAALEQHEEAALAFDQARAIGLPWRMLWYQFGPFESYLNTGRYEDVILLADTTLEGRPYFEESYYFKGKALAAMGEEAAAIENLERAVTFNPNFVPAKIALVEFK
jgi:tetratricopeptide (TPR) repeat protein